MGINADIKPFKNLSIELSADRVFSKRFSQLIDVIDDDANDLTPGVFNNSPISEAGDFSISYFMLPNAFDGNGDSTFETFKENRLIIAQRLAGVPIDPNGSFPAGYGANSSQVSITRFFIRVFWSKCHKSKNKCF